MRIYKKPVYCCIMLVSMVIQGAAASNSFLKQANDLYDKGDYIKAVSLYRKALTAGENTSITCFNLANCYFQLDSIPQSIVYYRAVTDDAPDFFRGFLNLAIALYSLDDMGNCMAAITRALELDPTNEKAKMIRAAALRKAGAYPEAIVAFEKIRESDHGNSDILIALGEMMRDLGDVASAVDYLEQYPENGPNRIYVLTCIVDILEKENDTEKLIYYLEKLKEKDPSNRWTWYRECLQYEKTGNHLSAYEMAKEALIEFPDFGEMALFAGNSAFSLGQLSESFRYYSAAKVLGCPGAAAGLENVETARNRTVVQN